MSLTCDCRDCREHAQRSRLTESRLRQELEDLPTSKIIDQLRFFGVIIPAEASKDQLIDLLLATPEYKKKIRHHLDIGGYVPYRYTPLAISRRVQAIAQTFTYEIYNNAMKLIRYDKKVQWMVWITAADDRVCPLCEPLHMRRWRPWQFMPRMPLHVGCRCRWETWYEE